MIVYDRNCRIGGKLTLYDLEATKIGTMPQFKAACAYSASQGWLIVRAEVVTLTTGVTGTTAVIRTRSTRGLMGQNRIRGH